MFTSTINKPFPSYDFIIINASTLRKTQKIIYIWPENSYENSILLPKMSFKICYDAQVLRGNLVSPEESFSKCPGKGKETTGKNRRLKSWGQPELWPLHKRSLLFEHTLNIFGLFLFLFCFFFHQGITVYSSGQKADGAQVTCIQWKFYCLFLKYTFQCLVSRLEN